MTVIGTDLSWRDRAGALSINGLAAAVWTRDITKAHRIARDKSLHAFDKYTELKTTWIDLSR